MGGSGRVFQENWWLEVIVSGRYGCNDARWLYESDSSVFMDEVFSSEHGEWFGFGKDDSVGWFVLEQDAQGFVNLHEFGHDSWGKRAAWELWVAVCLYHREGVA